MINIKKYIQQVLKKENPIKYLIAVFLRYTKLCYFFTIKTPWFKMKFHPSNLSTMYWYNSKARKEDFEILKKFLQKGDIFVDIGANIGTHSLYASKLVGDTGKVYSYEPHPKTFKFFIKNINYNKIQNVNAENIAIGSKEGLLKFSNKIWDDMNKVSPKGNISVKTQPLDAIISEKNIALMKVDVEGFEDKVFEGAKKTLKKTKVIIFENSQETNSVLSMLKKNNFSIYTRRLKKVSKNYHSNNTENLIAINERYEGSKSPR